MSNIDTAEIADAICVMPSDVEGRHRAVLDVLRWFTFGHLPDGLPRSVSAMIAAVAGEVITMIDVDDPELTRGLSHLLTAKDSLVRAAIVAQHAGEDAQRAADLRAHVIGQGGPHPSWVTDDAAGVDDDGERDTARRMDALDEAARLEAGL